MERHHQHRFDWLGGAGTLLAILACYGTLAVVSVLSLLGVSLAIHEGAWASTIGLFAVIAVLGIALGYRLHRRPWPLALAVIGGGLVLWAMFIDYSRAIEIAGFAGLIVAAVWDWRAKRHPRPAEPARDTAQVVR